MAIKIIKRGGQVVLPSKIVGKQPTIEAKPEPLPPAQKTEIKRKWLHTVPPPDAKPKTCDYCGHVYLMPCTEEQYPRCSNWLHKQSTPTPSSSTSPSASPSGAPSA